MMMPMRMIMIMRMFVNMIRTHFTAAIGHDTRHMLKLNGGVMNSEAAANFTKFFQNRFAFGMGHVVNQYV